MEFEPPTNGDITTNFLFSALCSALPADFNSIVQMLLKGKMKRTAALNLSVLLSFSFAIVVGLYFFNTWFQIRWEEVWGFELGLPMHHVFFAEGVFFLLIGLLLLLGSGGINRWSISAILNTSVADWLYGRESDRERVRPSEILHADRWRPKGFPRTGLICMFTSIIMLLTYALHFAAFGW